jgi:putative spermidine/putrescine transport system permease protein
MQRYVDKLISGYVALLTVAMVLPTVVVLIASLTPREYLAFPPGGLSFRWYGAVFESGVWMSALWVSIRIATLVTIAALLLGIPAALALRAAKSRISATLQAVFLSPLMIPSILIGLGLLRFFDEMHVRPSVATVALGHTLLATPYVIRYVLAGLAGVDPALERAAGILGAGKWRTFSKVTFPLMRHGIVAGALFSFIISLDDVNIALFLSDIRVVPFSVKLMSHVEQNADPLGAAVASVLVLIALAVLFVCDRIAGIDWMFGIKGSRHE